MRTKGLLLHTLSLVAMLSMVLALAPTALQRRAYAAEREQVVSLEQLDRPGVTIGVGTGDVAGRAVAERFPDATIRYFDDKFLGYEAVAQGKIDGFAYDRRQMELSIAAGQKGVRLLDETFERKTQICVGISGLSHFPDWERTINRFLDELRADGTLDDMYRRWVVENQEVMPSIERPTHPSEHLIVATSGIVPPYSHYQGDQLMGYDIELAYRLAAWLDADVEFVVMDYGAIFAAASAGQVDCVMADLQADDERRESFLFSDPLFEEQVGLMVRDVSGTSGGNGWWRGFAASFEKTFLREDRWRLFVRGIGATLVITIASTLVGIVAGFVLFRLYQKSGPAAQAIARICLWIVRGMPMVVLLMVLYYVVFARVAIESILVAIAGFSLTTGAGVFALLQMGVGAIDVGQSEAAYALGYGEGPTFFRVVLPQALPHILPAFRQQTIELLKATSIVGYIAVQDLTKMGDIVRSRTYEAFFPLAAVTVIYFALELLLGWVMRVVERRLDRTRRSPERLLRGVRRV